MLSKFIIALGLLLLFVNIGKAQNISDSTFYDQKFKRLQFQIDSLKGASGSKGNGFDALQQKALVDSLQRMYIKSEKEIIAIRHNLFKAHLQIQTANYITGFGVVLSAISTYFTLAGDKSFGAYAAVTGAGGVLFAGVIAPLVRIDAFRHLKSAGKDYRLVKKI